MSDLNPMNPLQYVILRHEDVERPHFDLMFETLPGSQLSTWHSEQWPIESRVSLTRLRDHRRAFLEFEGALAGHRGSVVQVARGTCEVEIGEHAVWTIRLLTDSMPQQLLFRQVDAERWECAPVSSQRVRE